MGGSMDLQHAAVMENVWFRLIGGEIDQTHLKKQITTYCQLIMTIIQLCILVSIHHLAQNMKMHGS